MTIFTKFSALLLFLVWTASAQYIFVDLGSATPTSGSGNEITGGVNFDASTINNDWYSYYIGGANPAVSLANSCNVSYSSYSGLFEITSDDGTTAYHPDSTGHASNSQCALIAGANGISGNGSQYTVINANKAQLRWHVQFSTAMQNNNLAIWAYGAISGCQTIPADCSGWQRLGTWTPTVPTMPIIGPPPPMSVPPPNWNTNFVPPGGSGSNFFNVYPAYTSQSGSFTSCWLISGPGGLGPDQNALIKGIALDPTPGSLYHPHDVDGLHRPNITVASGNYLTDVNGCAHIPGTTPEFAGTYWALFTNITRGTTDVGEFPTADSNSPFYGYDLHLASLTEGSGINGAWTVSDPDHQNDIVSLNASLMFRLAGIGTGYYALVFPLAKLSYPDEDKLSFLMGSLPFGGTLDYARAGSGNFASGNLHQHASGDAVDIMNQYIVGSLGVQKREGDAVQAIIRLQNCSVQAAKYQNGTVNQTLKLASVWHIYGCH